EYPGIVPVEQVVFDPGKALPLAALEDDHVLCTFYIKDGHTEERASLPVRRGIDRVVCPDNKDNIRAGKFRVDLVTVKEPVIGNPRFGKEHVHMPGHTAGNRVDGKLHRDVPVFEKV